MESKSDKFYWQSFVLSSGLHTVYGEMVNRKQRPFEYIGEKNKNSRSGDYALLNFKEITYEEYMLFLTENKSTNQ